MDNKYFAEINSNLEAFMTEHGFAVTDDGAFTSESKKFKTEYDENRREFLFQYAEADASGEIGNFAEISSWLFDEQNHGANDTKIIADDFIEAASIKLGIIKKNVKTNAQVSMPSKAEAGQTPGVEAFTNKFLAMFPQYKDAYKEHVAKFGQLLPIEFYKNYGVEKCREVIDSGNKKSIGKLFAMMNDLYVDGDKDVGNIICAVIIAGTFKGNVAEFDKLAADYFPDCTYLKQAGRAAIGEYKANSKLRAIFTA